MEENICYEMCKKNMKIYKHRTYNLVKHEDQKIYY